MNRTLLFVSGDKNFREKIERELTRPDDQWIVKFTGRAREALGIIANEGINTVAVEPVLPDADGLKFLDEVREQFPDVVRLFISDFPENRIPPEELLLVHQFLSKPFDDEKLALTVERAFLVRSMLERKALRKLLMELKSIPPMPSLYMSLIDALSDSSTPVAAIGEIVAGDTAITARILETVNSSFFGLTRVVRSPSHAVALLGLDMIKALVLSLEVVSEFEGTVMPGDMSVDALWDHGMAVGAAARRISMAEGGDKESVDLAMAAGLLHDQGKLVLAENLDEKYADILKFSSEKDISFYDAEKSSFGVTHSDICAYIMAMWGMPKRLVDAIRYHHNPDDAAEYGFNVLAAVHTADALVNFMDDDGIPGGNVKPDAEFLRKSRLEKKLPEWTDTIRQVVNDGKVLR